MKQKTPTQAQAKRIAEVWTRWEGCNLSVEGYQFPTDKVLQRNGWIVPEGEPGRWPGGDLYQRHIVSAEGFAALERYLFSIRVRTGL